MAPPKPTTYQIYTSQIYFPVAIHPSLLLLFGSDIIPQSSARPIKSERWSEPFADIIHLLWDSVVPKPAKVPDTSYTDC